MYEDWYSLNLLNHSLEEPCLEHLHGDPNKPHEATGHALTASAHLLCVAPRSPSQSPASLNVPLPAYDKTSSAVLDRLLSLSPDLSADGEVTPIQAWNHIRCQPQFANVGARSLRNLAEQLRDAAKCHGYAANSALHITEIVFLTNTTGLELLLIRRLSRGCSQRHYAQGGHFDILIGRYCTMLYNIQEEFGLVR